MASLGTLPQDILIEILSHLAPKSATDKHDFLTFLNTHAATITLYHAAISAFFASCSIPAIIFANMAPLRQQITTIETHTLLDSHKFVALIQHLEVEVCVCSHKEGNQAMDELARLFEEAGELKSMIVRIHARKGAVAGASYGMGVKVASQTYLEASSRACERNVEITVTLEA